MDPGSRLTVRLHINPVLIEDAAASSSDKSRRDFVPLTISFSGVGAVQILELETWEYQIDESHALIDSSFEIVKNSPWIAKLTDPTGEYQPMVSPEDSHLELLTYDHVITVVCKEFRFQ